MSKPWVRPSIPGCGGDLADILFEQRQKMLAASSSPFQVFFCFQSITSARTLSQVPLCSSFMYSITYQVFNQQRRGVFLFWLFCLSFNNVGLLDVFGSCDHFVSLQFDSRNTTHNTVPTHETHCFVNTMSFKKVPHWQVLRKNNYFFLNFKYNMQWNFSTFPTCVFPHKQTDDKRLCITNQLGQN